MMSSAISQSPAENFSLTDIKLTLLILGLLEFLLLHLLTARKTISGFFFSPRFQSSIISSDESKNSMETSTKQGDKKVDQSVSGEDVEIVLRSLGMLCRNCDELAASYDADDLLFEERNPSMDEVKEAFDENGDGFMDAEELQKVMWALRLTEGYELEKCRAMIGVFDRNGDGRMDFEEFLKFMELN
ncbi:hypothetical protein ACS0TY_005901 [Phlomoides rotata]